MKVWVRVAVLAAIGIFMIAWLAWRRSPPEYAPYEGYDDSDAEDADAEDADAEDADAEPEADAPEAPEADAPEAPEADAPEALEAAETDAPDATETQPETQEYVPGVQYAASDSPEVYYDPYYIVRNPRTVTMRPYEPRYEPLYTQPPSTPRPTTKPPLIIKGINTKTFEDLQRETTTKPPKVVVARVVPAVAPARVVPAVAPARVVPAQRQAGFPGHKGRAIVTKRASAATKPKKK